MDEQLRQRGFGNNSFVALQPTIDATSRQVDGGGYEAVYQWVLANRRAGIRKYFVPTLFSTSTTYDAIIIHLDGDVADISASFAASVYSGNCTAVADRVSSVRSWILGSLQAEPSFAGSVIVAVPTLQMESWILAALNPTISQIESRNRKNLVKRFLRNKFGGNAIDQVQKAGATSRGSLANMRARAISFDMFDSDLRKRF